MVVPVVSGTAVPLVAIYDYSSSYSSYYSNTRYGTAVTNYLFPNKKKYILFDHPIVTNGSENIIRNKRCRLVTNKQNS